MFIFQRNLNLLPLDFKVIVLSAFAFIHTIQLHKFYLILPTLFIV